MMTNKQIRAACQPRRKSIQIGRSIEVFVVGILTVIAICMAICALILSIGMTWQLISHILR